MSHSLHLLLRSLLGLFALYWLTCAIVIAAKRSATATATVIELTKNIATDIRDAARLATKPVLTFTLGCFAGYSVAVIRQDDHLPALENVTVIKKHTLDSYRMVKSSGEGFEVTFCEDSPTDLEVGDKIKVLAYEQRRGCKSIAGHNLGYRVYTDAEGNRIKFPTDNLEREDIAYAR